MDGIPGKSRWNGIHRKQIFFLEMRANKKRSFTTFKQSIHHKSKCRVVALQNKENEETDCTMLQKFSKGEDKAFFRQNDIFYYQIDFFREINE